MKDRVSTYPGRVRLTPVSGQTNVYDLERADQPTEIGTPLNKSNLLSDSTVAALLGLSSYSGDMTVNEAFIKSIYRLTDCHWWEKFSTRYVEKRTNVANIASWQTSNTYKYVACGSATYAGATTFQYSNTITIDESTGAITLVNPTTVSRTGTATGELLQNKYFKFVSSTTGKVDAGFNTSDIYYYSGSTFGTSQINASYYNTFTYASMFVVTAERVKNAFLEDVYDSNDTAFPNPNGVSGIYYYEYKGIPLNMIFSGMQIERGSYVGTGVNATSTAPFELTLSKKPVIFFVSKKQTSSDPTAMYHYMMTYYGQTEDEPDAFYQYGYDRGGTNYLNSRIVGTTIQWYSINTGSPAAYDLNENGTTYYWMAFVA